MHTLGKKSVKKWKIRSLFINHHVHASTLRSHSCSLFNKSKFHRPICLYLDAKTLFLEILLYSLTTYFEHFSAFFTNGKFLYKCRATQKNFFSYKKLPVGFSGLLDQIRHPFCPMRHNYQDIRHNTKIYGDTLFQFLN